MSKKKQDYDVFTIEQIRNKWNSFCDWLHENTVDEEHANIEAEIDAMFDWAEETLSCAGDIACAEDNLRSALNEVETAREISDKIQVLKKEKVKE